MKESYFDYCKNFIVDHIEDHEGREVYGCDLGNYITESINVDGSATYSTYEAKEYIKEWFEEAGEVYEYQKANYGAPLHNPFEEPEAFHVCMIIEGVNSILSQCATIDNAWNDEIVLDADTIKAILSEVEEVTEINL